MRDNKFDHCLVSKNIRFLLYLENRDSAEWLSLFRKKIRKNDWGDKQVIDFLQGGLPSDSEIRDLAEAFGQEEDMLRNSDLLANAGIDILLDNLKFLLDSLEHGGKSLLANHLEISQGTISKWLKGTHPPQKPTMKGLVNYFGLDPDTDLTSTPVFLSYDPVTVMARKKWLRERIDALSSEQLKMHFPSLEKILKEE
ncbi:helix-turn-helix domain-containing protein [Thermodesulfobacteriota bacterium]